MEERRHLHYKNNKPKDTVVYIQSILNEIGIEVEELWMPQSSAQTYSLRLVIKHTRLGTNGKGVTPEYARASAYAELMERLQNKWMTRFYFNSKELEKRKDYYYSHDEIKMTTSEVASLDNSFFRMLYASCQLQNPSYEDKIKMLTQIHLLEYELTGEKDTWTMVPFYSLKEGELVYLPFSLYNSYYGSNGMCAGNTPMEALIQGISEIVERYVQREVIKKSYTIPSFSEEYLSGFPEIKKKLQLLNQIPGYRFILKDSSLGGRYPVAVLASIELNSGCYGLKFGSHPDIEIAMERAITETSQGMDFRQYCKKSKLNFCNDIVRNEDNIANICRSGRGQYPYEFFLEKPTYEFREVKDMTNQSDESMLRYLLQEVIGSQYDIYVRDVSVLGFPSYHIIIPNISEMNRLDIKMHRNVALKYSIRSLINEPEKITSENVLYLEHVLNSFGLNDMQNSVTSLSGTLLHTEDYPGEEIQLGWLYMVMLCKVMQKNYVKAYQYMIKLYSISQTYGVQESNRYKEILDYLQGMTVMQNHDKVINYLRQFYTNEVCEKLNFYFVDPKKVFVRHYPIHNKTRENCERAKCCDFYSYLDIIDKIRRNAEQKQIDQIDLGEFLREISFEIQSEVPQ